MERRGVGGRRPRPRLDLDDVVYGVHAVEEALNQGELRRIHIADERRRDPALRALLEGAAEREVTLRFEGRDFFTNFPYRAHQGVVAFANPFDYASLDELLAQKRDGPRLFVVLDHVTDPHNVGAIVRSAECAGATALVLPERRSAGINATVRKAAAGAASYLPVARVANIANAIRALQKAGVWVAGAALEEGATPYDRADWTADSAIVIGAEGEGLAPLIRRSCDFLVAIPIVGKTESLNASVAAGILLYEALRQRTNGARSPQEGE